MSGQGVSFDTWIGWAISAASGGILTKLGDALFGRKEREVKALGDTIKILSDAQERFESRLEKAEEKVDECEAKHEACEKGRQEDRREIEELWSLVRRAGTPAYHLNAPKGDPSKGRGK